MNNSKSMILMVAAISTLATAGVSSFDVFADGDVLPPLKQVEMGVAPEDVTCKDDLILMLKTSGAPICVYSTSVDRLVSMDIAVVVDVSDRDDSEMMMKDDDDSEMMMKDDDDSEMMMKDDDDSEMMMKDDDDSEMMMKDDDDSEMMMKDDDDSEMMMKDDDDSEMMMKDDDDSEMMMKDDDDSEMMMKDDDDSDMMDMNSDLVVSMTGYSDRFDAMRNDASATTQTAIDLYDMNGSDAFDMITSNADMLSHGELYPFVLDSETMEIIAHGFDPTRVGSISSALVTLKDTIQDIQERLEADGETWSMYMMANPDSGKDAIKKSFLKLHDGYIFGSGFYLTQLEADMMKAMWVAESAAMLYDNSGNGAFDEINSASDEYMVGDFYPFISDIETKQIVAHGADAERVGDVSVSLTDANKSFEQILLEFEINNGTWISYTFENFETGDESYKVSWVTTRDNYIIGSGFYPDDYDAGKIRAMMSTDMALALYAEFGTDAFDKITALNVDEDWYPFVVEDETAVEVADGSVFDRTGSPVMTVQEHRAFTADVRDVLDAGQGAFTTYVFTNPETEESQSKKSWIVLTDGYLFGAGMYLEGEWADKVAAKWSVSKTIEMYKDNAAGTITSINEMMSTDPSYPFILDSELIIVANGADVAHVGQDLITLTNPDKTKEQILEELNSDMATSWISYTFTHPETGEDAEKISILRMHDNHVFGAGYYPAEITDADTGMK